MGRLFSGIGGFDEGFRRAGFQIAWQAEIEPDCVAVLSRHWPTVRRHRDINALVYGKHRNRQRHGLVLEPVDVIVGGFPCQDVSVAGQRRGLAGSRSGLFFAFMRAVRIMRARFGKPDWLVIENVPGLLTSHRGRDFHTVLSEVAECGFRRAYRILDSRYFGVAQRRRRVFIVGHCGDGERARTVLFEPTRSARDSQARRPAMARVAASLRGRSSRAGVNEPGRGGEDDLNLIAFDWQSGGSAGRLNCSSSSSSSSSSSLQASQTPAIAFTIPSVHRGVGNGHNTNYLPIMATLNSGGNDGGFRTEPGEHLLVSSSGERARALTATCYKRHDEDTDTLIASPITASAGHHGHSSPRGDGRDNLVATWDERQVTSGANRTSVGYDRPANTLHERPLSAIGSAGVRRLTPLECERLQGFPDGWTCLCGEGHRGSQYCTCPDTPRYKALGNAVTVPVAEWIARRLLEATA